MIINFTTLSPDYAAFGRSFGEPFVCDPSVYREFFEPSIIDLKRYNVFQGYNALGQQLEVEIGLVMNKKIPNAYCAFDQNKHYVLIEHLFPIGLIEFFHRLLANPNVLPDLGNVEMDSRFQRIHDTNYLPGFEILVGAKKIANLDQIAEYYGSLCPQRRKAATLLYQHAMTFLYSHELTHALLGHVLYVKHHMGAKSLQEFRQEPDDELTRKINCYLEQQADNGATWNLIGQHIFLSKDDREIAQRVSDAAFRILGSSLLLYYFALIDVNYSGGDTSAIYQWYDHPASAARAIFVTTVPMMQIPKSQSNQLAKQVVEDACLTARRELLRIADGVELFRPYNWLRKESLMGLFDEKLTLSENEKDEIDQTITPYAFKQIQ